MLKKRRWGSNPRPLVWSQALYHWATALPSPGCKFEIKSVWSNFFFISQPKHTVWVLKRTISLRCFFWAPEPSQWDGFFEHLNHLNEMVLLSTQNKCFNWLIIKYSKFHAQNVCIPLPIAVVSMLANNSTSYHAHFLTESLKMVILTSMALWLKLKVELCSPSLLVSQISV